MGWIGSWVHKFTWQRVASGRVDENRPTDTLFFGYFPDRPCLVGAFCVEFIRQCMCVCVCVCVCVVQCERASGTQPDLVRDSRAQEPRKLPRFFDDRAKRQKRPDSSPHRHSQSDSENPSSPTCRHAAPDYYWDKFNSAAQSIPSDRLTTFFRDLQPVCIANCRCCLVGLLRH